MVASCILMVWVLTHAHSPSLEIFAFFMLTGVFSTMLIPETSHKSLEVISNESQDDFIQGMFCGLSGMVRSLSSRPHAAVPPSENGSGYLGNFQTSPIMLSPLESHILTSLPSRPQTALSDHSHYTHKAHKASLTRLASMSNMSATS